MVSQLTSLVFINLMRVESLLCNFGSKVCHDFNVGFRSLLTRNREVRSFQFILENEKK